MKLADVFEELAEERGLDKATLSAIVCEGIKAAYERKFPEAIFTVAYQKKSGTIAVELKKTVVEEPVDDLTQISLRKARLIDPSIEIDGEVTVPFEGPIGRLEIIRAKQVIAQKIKEIESSAIYKEFKPKENSIINGIVHRVEVGGVVVKLQNYYAFMPKSLSIPGQKYIVGYPLRALLKEVLLEPRHENQLILDRASEEFIKKLFELEIPEVYEKLVEIKDIVRIPGYKSKVVVLSNDSNIDPVGTCVGMGGARIKPILREVGTEKIDIIAWSDEPADFIRDALKPAEIKRIEILEGKQARIYVSDEQRAVAIGKLGQNIALASRVTGYAIQLADSSPVPEKKVEPQEHAEFEDNIV